MGCLCQHISSIVISKLKIFIQLLILIFLSFKVSKNSVCIHSNARTYVSSDFLLSLNVFLTFFQDIEWKNIGGKKISSLLIRDPAYPLLPWLMKPFSENGHLSPAQLRFNYRLSRARMVVEGCFGRLKGRWRVLLKKIDAKLDKAIEVASDCCVLNKFCEALGQEFDLGLMPDHTNEEAEPGPQQQEHNSQEVRRALVSLFS